MPEHADRDSALGGMRVVELGDGVAPAFAGRWLAAFGARVIKVEPPGGSWTRRYSPNGGPVAAASGPLAAFLDAGKQSIALDLDAAQGRARLQELIADGDIFIHDLEPARLARAVPALTDIRARRPGLVEVALLPFGSDGPYAGYAATSIVLLALGGYQYLTGEPGREPLMLPGFQPEYLTAFYGIIAGLAGILARASDGGGRRFEVCAMEALASLHQFTTSQWLYEGTIRSRQGNRWENLYPITMLPCRDGYLALSMPSPEMWERLCLMIERPDVIADPRFATSALRRRNADELDAILIAWLSSRTMAEVFATAQEAWRLPVNPYLELDEVLRDPQYQARGFWVRPDGDSTGLLHPGMPVIMSATPWKIRTYPPAPSKGLRGPPSVVLGTPLAPLGPQSGRSDPAEGLKGGGAWRSATATQRGAVPRSGQEPLRSAVPTSEAPLPFRALRGDRGVPADLPMTGGEVALPLAGLCVLDFTRVWSGPLCTRILADLGARVIKIEPPFPRNAPAGPAALLGDPTARPVAGLGKLNRNKLSVGIDLRLPAGRDLLKRLAAHADVLVENFSARVMPNFGLDYQSLREVNPGLIYLAMSGYGGTGPYREYLGYGSATEAMVGLTALLGYRDEQPLNSAIAYPDPVAGLAGCASVLTALVYRERTGAGQFLDLSQLEPASMVLGEFFLAAQMEGVRPARTGNEHPEHAPHGTYRCRGEDEWVSLAVRSDEEWVAFCRITGLTDLGSDPTCKTASGRRAHRRVLDAAISSWTRSQDKFDVMERLQRGGIPAGAVLNARELVEDPHLAGRGFMVDARAPEGGSFPMPGTPITVDGGKRRDWQAAPIRGEHNRMVLREVLGMTDSEIESLTSAGVLVGAGAPVS